MEKRNLLVFGEEAVEVCNCSAGPQSCGTVCRLPCRFPLEVVTLGGELPSRGTVKPGGPRPAAAEQASLCWVHGMVVLGKSLPAVSGEHRPSWASPAYAENQNGTEVPLLLTRTFSHLAVKSIMFARLRCTVTCTVLCVSGLLLNWSSGTSCCHRSFLLWEERTNSVCFSCVTSLKVVFLVVVVPSHAICFLFAFVASFSLGSCHVGTWDVWYRGRCLHTQTNITGHISVRHLKAMLTLQIFSEIMLIIVTSSIQLTSLCSLHLLKSGSTQDLGDPEHVI